MAQAIRERRGGSGRRDNTNASGTTNLGENLSDSPTRSLDRASMAVSSLYNSKLDVMYRASFVPKFPALWASIFEEVNEQSDWVK